MRTILLAMLLVGCGSSVQVERADASAGAGGETAGSGGVGGFGASASSGGAGGGAGDGGEGGVACVDPEPDWTTCHVGVTEPNRCVPPPCSGPDLCVDDTGYCPQEPCVGWTYDPNTDTCLPYPFEKVYGCGPGTTIATAPNGETYPVGPMDCIVTGTFGTPETDPMWSCCVPHVRQGQ